jgi:hypothetical protein
VINFAAHRHSLFEDAISPACSVLLRPVKPDGQPITYICPKPSSTAEDYYRMVIAPHDIHRVAVVDAATDPLVWTVLLWGGRRDLSLIRRLSQSPTDQQHGHRARGDHPRLGTA